MSYQSKKYCLKHNKKGKYYFYIKIPSRKVKVKSRKYIRYNIIAQNDCILIIIWYSKNPQLKTITKNLRINIGHLYYRYRFHILPINS